VQLSLEKLQKFFKLEAERGYDNRAVVGGLDKILISWEAQARMDNLPEDKIQSVLSQIRKYPQLEAEQRAETLRSLGRSLRLSIVDRPIPSTTVDKENLPPPSQNKMKHSNRGAFQSVPDSPKTYERRRTSTPRTRLVEPHMQEPSKTSPSQDRSDNTGLTAPLSVINGIGSKHIQTLSQLGLQNIEDLLYFFPRRYDDFSQLKTISQLSFGEEVTIIASVQTVSNRMVGKSQNQLTEVVVTDGTGSLRLNWFNQPWQASRFKSGSPITISGKVDQFLGRPVMTNPECETINQEQLNTNRIVPVYSLSGNLTQHWLRRIIFQTINYWGPRIPDYLPVTIKKTAKLVDLSSALQHCHFPESQEQLQAARERLAFDEIFLLQLGVMRQKRAWHAAVARKYAITSEELKKLTSLLPFELTTAQLYAINDIQQDLISGSPMNRLLQGDVGSGKTVVAAIGIAIVTSHGAQAALMAPTSILAEQHYRSLINLFINPGNHEDSCFKTGEIRLLIGATPEDEKQEIREKLESGEIKLIIGTHALIEDPVVFNNLQFIVVDEQHRFGVDQRAMLRSKGENPHLLVMTATPIPRTLALTLYGDLDLTIIDELPAGRQVVSTHILDPRERERAYALIRSQVENQHQAFIIYPLIEKGERGEEQAAVDEHARLQKEIFPNLNIGLLHGRLRPDQKDEVMRGFRDGEYQILVSTSVVEVGVDIPNATVMLIEGANRFGLAQLHQFRGRVGRGSSKSYCLLISDSGIGTENQRLTVMTETNNGFILAEKDLSLRGPGEFLGIRQSGYAELKMANITDIHLIEKARAHAHFLFEADPDMLNPENQPLFQKMDTFWNRNKGEVS
jgi:ATP-dependent DNA helicase RecG